MSVFEIAARKKFRFETSKGMLSAEDLFDLPLTQASDKNPVSLDGVARGLYKHIQEEGVVSFVSDTTKVDETLQAKFDLVKRVIEIKKAEQAEARLSAERRAQKQRIMEIMSSKQTEALHGMSLEELAKMLESF